MSFNPFKKMSDDLKKGFEKMQEDFNKFFNIQKKPEANEATNNPQNPEAKKSEENKTSNVIQPNKSSQLAQKPTDQKSGSMQDNWNMFAKSAQDNAQKMQEKWETNYKKFQDKLKKSNDNIKNQLTQANTNMQTMFANQQQQMKAFFNKIEQDIQSSNEHNREKVLQSINNIANGWNQFMHKQQNQLEHTMSQWNKLAFRGQLNFILWLIPILILVIIIFAVLKPFLSFIPY